MELVSERERDRHTVHGGLPIGGHMDLREDQRESFVIRIWLEEPAEAGLPPVWRGTITHLPGGERRYLRDLRAIPTFIAPYLDEMGAAHDAGPGLRGWLSRWISFPKGR
jgi:hypothetical protein